MGQAFCAMQGQYMLITIYQDGKSTILLTENGKLRSTRGCVISMYGIYIDKITKIGQGGISPYE